MAAAPLASSRWEWLSAIAIPYVLLPAAGIGLPGMVVAGFARLDLYP